MLIFDQLRKNDRQLQVLSVCVLSGLGVLLLGLWYVQVLSAKRFKNTQISQSFRAVRIPAIRGKILDANGVVFAENRPSYNVNLYLDELRPLFQTRYSNAKSRMLLELKKSGANPRLSREQIIQLGRQTRYQVVSNLFTSVTSALQSPQFLDEKQFLRHYDQRLFLPMPVLAGLTPQQTALFVEQTGNFPGFDLDVQPLRVYPHRATAAHLLGHLQRDDSVDDEDVFFNYRMPDFKGVVGVEGVFDEPLRGRTGIKSVLVNSLGYRQSENTWAPAEAGRNVFLTIDLTIQKAAEQALRGAPVPYSGPPRGAVVVMDPRTGDLIAMASNPTYDPNDLVQHLSPEKAEYLNDPTLRPQINRAMQENYAPGSIFKIVVGLAGLEAGTLDPEEIYHSQGEYKLGGRTIRDPAGPGEFKFRRALLKSSNSYFIREGMKLGVDRIVEMGQRFHLGERTGLLPRQEAAGILPTREWRKENLPGAWFDGNTMNISFGQGELAVTPLQVAVMISAVANGGRVFGPRLVARTESQDPFAGDPAIRFPAGQIRGQLNVSKRSLDIVREAMLADVEDAEGTGKKAAVQGLRICAKTGTAQRMIGRKVIGHTIWFASFAPYEDPRYVVIVMLETEQGGSGGDNCAPVAQQVYLALQKRDQPSKPTKPDTLANR